MSDILGSYWRGTHRLYTDPGVSADDLPAISEGILRLARGLDRPAILGAQEGDLIEVIQPDGESETYRLAKATPTADGFGVSFETERLP